MSVPTPPPERQSAYPHQTPPPPPVPPAAADPPAVFPAAVPPQTPTPPARGPSVEAGRFWAGVAATALVTALIGVVGVVIVDRILQIDLVVQDPFGTGSSGAAYVIGGAVAAVLAGGILHLLVVSTPKPQAFFGWIMFLATLTLALLPLAWTDELASAIATGVINALMGIAIWSLLLGVLSRTLRPGALVD